MEILKYKKQFKKNIYFYKLVYIQQQTKYYSNIYNNLKQIKIYNTSNINIIIRYLLLKKFNIMLIKIISFVWKTEDKIYLI